MPKMGYSEPNYTFLDFCIKVVIDICVILLKTKLITMLRMGECRGYYTPTRIRTQLWG